MEQGITNAKIDMGVNEKSRCSLSLGHGVKGGYRNRQEAYIKTFDATPRHLDVLCR